MIKRRHLEQFSGVLEGLLGKINQDCRMDGMEEVLDAGNLPKKLFHYARLLPVWHLGP